MERNLVDLLFSSEMAVILDAADSPSVDAISAMTGLPVVLFSERHGQLTFRGSSRKLSDLSSPPTFICVLLASSSKSRARLSRLVDWWMRAGSQPPTIKIAASTPEAIATTALRELLQLSVVASQQSAEREMELHDQILSLREMGEDTRALLAYLRSFTGGISAVPVLTCEPSNERWVPESDGVTARFKLALLSRGLSRLDLHFTGQAGAQGSLGIRLCGDDGELTLGTWDVPFERACGWLALPLAEALLTTTRRVSLDIHWHTTAGEAPQLSLADSYMGPEGAASVDDPIMQIKVPAIRVYRGVPGQSISPRLQ